MKFITLTIWDANRYMGISQHGKPIWINPEKIISMNEQFLRYISTEDERIAPIKDRPQENCTYIHFGAQGSEDSDGIYVCETPAQIIGHIKYGGIS